MLQPAPLWYDLVWAQRRRNRVEYYETEDLDKIRGWSALGVSGTAGYERTGAILDVWRVGYLGDLAEWSHVPGGVHELVRLGAGVGAHGAEL
jgi:hypothetical protein